jgi:prepilin peptidase CpaA
VDVRAILELAPLLVALVWAAAVDVRTRRIPNWLSLSLLAAGLTRALMPQAPITIGHAVTGGLAGLALLLPLFVLKGVGGGDVKLLAAVGTWLGPAGVLTVYIIEAMVGMVMAVAQAIAQGRLGALMQNSALVTVNLAHLREVGVDHVVETGRSAQAPHEKLHMPWAVPLLIAFIVLGVGKWFAA